MLVHGAALDSHVRPQRRQRLFQARRAVDHDQLRRSQSAPDEIVEQRAPGRLALAAHALDRQQHFLAVAARRAPRAARSRSLFCRADTRDRPVEDQPHDRLFGERARIPGVPVALRLRQTRLTTSLPTGPQTPRSTRVARGGFPCEISPAIKRRARARLARSEPLRHSRVFRPRRSTARADGDPRLAKRARQRPLRCPWRTPTTDGVASSSPSLRRP